MVQLAQVVGKSTMKRIRRRELHSSSLVLARSVRISLTSKRLGSENTDCALRWDKGDCNHISPR